MLVTLNHNSPNEQKPELVSFKREKAEASALSKRSPEMVKDTLREDDVLLAVEAMSNNELIH